MTALPDIDGYVPDFTANEEATRREDQSVAQAAKSYLSDVRAGLETLQRAGGAGRQVNEAHAVAIDQLVRRLAALAEAHYYAAGGDLGGRVAVVAVGGYGRREMAIASDVDLLFLYRKRLDPLAANVAERIQYWLWDAGAQVGGAVRSLKDTVSLAREDDTVATALLDARFLGGDGELFHQLLAAVRSDVLRDPAGFIRTRIAMRDERHKKFGESLYLLQPNLKDGAGGLRDYQAAYWSARAIAPIAPGPSGLLDVGLLTEPEANTLGAALDFLWRVRNDMHLLLGRKEDQMSFEHQEHIAKLHGYEDDGQGLPVEQFMGDYYRHARAIGNLSEIVIEQCEARSRPRRRLPRVREVTEGFRVSGPQLEVPHAAHLRERPVRLLRAFLVAQEEKVELSRTAMRLIRENLDLCDEALQRDPEAAQTLLSILASEHRVMRTLMEMNEVGLLGAFLPEWEHIVCRWQHVIYHTYTVDVHSIFLVEELRRLWKGEYQDESGDLTELIRSAGDLPVIFLGCLLHDIGKGFGGEHSEKGAVRARRCLERLGLEADRTERIEFLVLHHLTMNHIAQRRDLSDPRVIVEFARLVKDRENLRNLYLVTFADIRASSRSSWNEWKGQLLRELYERTSEFLEAGRDDPQRAMELIDARVEIRQEAARKELAGFGPELEAYFAGLPRRYFVAHKPRQIARHANVFLSLKPGDTMATAVREMRAGFSEFIVWTEDISRLYALVAGTLTGLGFNILGSHVYTTRSGLALEVYRLTTPAGGEGERRLAWEELDRTLAAVLRGERDAEELVRTRRRRSGPLPTRNSPSVAVSNDESDFYTVVDVNADDQIGLLYRLVRTIADHGYEIYASKATTVLDQVADSFYLKDRARRKITDPGELAQLENDLLAVARGDFEDD